MNPSATDPDDRVYDVTCSAERQVGEDRFGGAWIDREDPERPLIGVAVVEPSQRDIDVINEAGKTAGWPVYIVAVRYSRATLLGFLESLNGTPLPGDA